MQYHKHWHIHTICDYNFLERHILLVLFSYGLVWYFRCFTLVCLVQFLFKALFLSKRNKLSNWNPEEFEETLPTGWLKPYIPTTSFWFCATRSCSNFFQLLFFLSVYLCALWSPLRQRAEVPEHSERKAAISGFTGCKKWSRNNWKWHSVLWFSWQGDVLPKVGLNGHGVLSQP